MTQIQPATTGSPSTDAEATFNMENIGIEFEYPIGHPRRPVNGETSRDLYTELGGSGSTWSLTHAPDGTMTSDHVGAEITSPILDLHSQEPEYWHAETIEFAEELGYPFAATGLGDTNFGMHLHLSELLNSQAAALHDMSQEPWMKLFVCTSMRKDSLDSWRRGGVNSSSFSTDFGGSKFTSLLPDRSYGSESGHYEWRLPEPMLPDQFGAVLHFLRLLEVEGQDEARSYAKGLVDSLDNRLAFVHQYEYWKNNHESFPHESGALEAEVNHEQATIDYAAELLEI